MIVSVEVIVPVAMIVMMVMISMVLGTVMIVGCGWRGRRGRQRGVGRISTAAPRMGVCLPSCPSPTRQTTYKLLDASSNPRAAAGSI